MLDTYTDNRLTILLTLKDRVAFTWRWMRYANHIRCPFRIVIADGGADGDVSTILTKENLYPYLSYTYKRYPYDTTLVEYHRKVADALSCVQTEFVVMVDNDDFFIVEGFRQNLGFLCSHPDYSASGGAPIYFSVTRSEASSSDRPPEINGRAKGFHDPYSSHSVEQERAQGRVQSYLSPWCPTWYHVQRTTTLRRLWSVMSSLQLEELYWHERVLGCLTAADGKIQTLNGPYYFRQIHSHGTVSQSYRESGGMFCRMFHETWLGDFRRSVGAVADAVSTVDHLPRSDAVLFVEEQFKRTVREQLLWELRGFLHPANPTSPVAVAKRGYRWLRRQEASHRAKTISRAWETHPALTKIFEVLAETTVSTPAVLVDGELESHR